MARGERRRLKMGTKNLDYTLRLSDRARLMYVSISGRDEVVVSAPQRASMTSIERFVASRAQWIFRKLDELRNLPEHLFLPHSKRQYEMHKEAARAIALERLAHFNQAYGFSFKRVAIKNQKTRWGSCSKSGTLSFNYKIALLPPHLRDYVIVHELCHLGAMNHSRAFWQLVGRTMPEYARLRAELNGRRRKSDTRAL
jgi:predicted metal-dependent hydrolase